MNRSNLWEAFLMFTAVASLMLCLFLAATIQGLRSRINDLQRIQPVTIEHSLRGEEIVIRNGCEVVGEWEPGNGEVYEVLDEALHEQ